MPKITVTSLLITLIALAATGCLRCQVTATFVKIGGSPTTTTTTTTTTTAAPNEQTQTMHSNDLIHEDKDKNLRQAQLVVFVCHEQCARMGCSGPLANQCLQCNNYQVFDQANVRHCVANCTSTSQLGLLSYDSGNSTCTRCHPECELGCFGPEARHCKQCKNAQDGADCVSECPSNKFLKNGICLECDKSCAVGCTGRSHRLAEGGCRACSKAVVTSAQPFFAGYCIKAEESCPEGYYEEYIGHRPDEDPLSLSVGRPVCRKCHSRCKRCNGMGTHVSVCTCARYVSGEQCEDYCSRDHFADEERRQCVRCSPECNGCFGPTDLDCITCRAYRIYNDTYSAADVPVAAAQTQSRLTIMPQSSGVALESGPKQQVKFRCAEQCPPEKPFKVIERTMLDPYCSERPQPVEIVEKPLVTGRDVWMLAFVMMGGLVFCFLVRLCKKHEKDKTMDLTMKLSGFDDDEPLDQSNLQPNLAPLRSIKVTELRIGKQLGAGIGGTVHQGLWFPGGLEQKKRAVAIKILHDNEGQSNRNRQFLEEAYVMASVNHPNLVRLLGVCTTPNQLMLVTQLVPLGCLLDYVQKKRTKISSKNLLEWCKQIARGMAYLEERRMVHRDLALRNVLLQHHGRALISDFGLAKFLEVDQSEYHSGGGRLPIKWLAPECIKERKFTHKSDVWAFGVTVWELLTFGAKPFEDVDTKDAPMAIEKGARLEQPAHVTAEVYKVMYSCWFYDPVDRPDFKSLAQNFVAFARDPERYLPLGAKCFEYSPHADLGGRNSESELDALGLEEYSDLKTMVNHNMNNLMLMHGFGHQDQLLAEQISQPRSAPIAELAHATDVSAPFDFSSAHRLHAHHAHHHAHHKSSTAQLIATDANNNSFMTPDANANNRLSMQAPPGESFWQHAFSTNSLGEKCTEQPTDTYNYLIPSPCTDETDAGGHFSSFYASGATLPITPTSGPQMSFGSSRQPPHSAGLVGVTNEEYFMDSARANYVNQQKLLAEERKQLPRCNEASGAPLAKQPQQQQQQQQQQQETKRAAMSNSSGNIPHSLV